MTADARRAAEGALDALHFVCTDFPGPGNECVFVECEDGTGRSINAGEWVRRPDGLVALVVTALPAANPCSVCRQPLAPEGTPVIKESLKTAAPAPDAAPAKEGK